MKARFFVLTLLASFLMLTDVKLIYAVSIELKYDDGSSERSSSPWDDEVGSEIAVRFTPSSYPARLERVRFFVTSFGQPRTLFEVRIYDDNNGSFPGSRLDLGNLTAAATIGNEWVEIDVSSHNIVISSGDFFVSMYWITAPGLDGQRAQFLGSDLNGSKSNRSYFKFGGSGSWSLWGYRNMMIRALVTIDVPPSCGGLTATFVGTEGLDLLIGTAGSDVIVGLGGDDVIYGLGGNDVICGGSGNDVLLGGDGNDRLYGSPGRDTLLGEAGNDRLFGEGGNDYLNGGDWDDILNGGPGSDVCDGGSENVVDTTAHTSCESVLNVP